MTYQEVNFDGLIGPSHNYAGLSLGNVASAKNAGAVSNPKAAALQGLKKMRAVSSLGVVQGFLPPQARPDVKSLRALGFSGTDQEVIERAYRTSPELLANFYSASSMWSANAATIAPSIDTPDTKVHFTPANLAHNLHRSIEAGTTASILTHIFSNPDYFHHHQPLPGGQHFGDEGAANHGRIAESHSARGVHLFVYGENGDRFPARQKLSASHAVARNHGLADDQALFLQQSRAALDAGAFHNDVVGVTNENVIFLHEQSFEDHNGALSAIRDKFPDINLIIAKSAMVSLSDVVTSYLFNSQLLTLKDGQMALILPEEARENKNTKAFIDETLAGDNAIGHAKFLDVRQSMRNGGGPACLRLRVLLRDDELAATNQNFILDADKFDLLEKWVNKYYRDRLGLEDLRDPDLAVECFSALDALTSMLSMGAFYDFQNS